MRLTILLIVLCITNTGHTQIARTRDTLLMGGKFNITIVANDVATAERFIDTVIAEITRIEWLISDWKPSSQVSMVNRNAGIQPVRVDKELLDLTERAIRISEYSGGAFDISFAAMEKIWRFDGSMTKMPDSSLVKTAVEKVGYKNIIVNRDSSTIFLRLKGMKIGFGALGEGYAADRSKQLMLEHGIESGIVNATGDIQAWGSRPDGKSWKIGINDPFKNGSLAGILSIQGAITTSGSYEKFVIIDHKRYAHIINPATGYPATGLTSVTVTGPSTEMANALSTSIMVLGKEKGLQLIKGFSAYRCLMITDDRKYITSASFSGLQPHWTARPAANSSHTHKRRQ